MFFAVADLLSFFVPTLLKLHLKVDKDAHKDKEAHADQVVQDPIKVRLILWRLNHLLEYVERNRPVEANAAYHIAVLTHPGDKLAFISLSKTFIV